MMQVSILFFAIACIATHISVLGAEEREEFDKSEKLLENLEKRAPMDRSSMVRFGKRVPMNRFTMVRFGRAPMAPSSMARFGKRAPIDRSSMVRFGKRAPMDRSSMVRLGELDEWNYKGFTNRTLQRLHLISANDSSSGALLRLAYHVYHQPSGVDRFLCAQLTVESGRTCVSQRERDDLGEEDPWSLIWQRYSKNVATAIRRVTFSKQVVYMKLDGDINIHSG